MSFIYFIKQAICSTYHKKSTTNASLHADETAPLPPTSYASKQPEDIISPPPHYAKSKTPWTDTAQKELPDPEQYISLFSENQLKELVIANRRGHDISLFADPDQTPQQLHFIYTHAEFGDDITPYIHNKSFNPAQIEAKESLALLYNITESYKARKPGTHSLHETIIVPKESDSAMRITTHE